MIHPAATVMRVKSRPSILVKGTLAAFAAVVVMLGASREARADYCGAEGERACTLTERIPSCNVNLVEGGGRCVRPQCGREGERSCTVVERVKLDPVLKTPVPAPCDLNLKHEVFKNLCFHPNCGREGANACTVLERVPSCDANLVEQAGKCIKPPLCGRLGQAACAVVVRIPSCDVDLIERAGVCERPGTAPTTSAPPKALRSIENSLQFLEEKVDGVLAAMPPARALSFLEVALYCVVTHLPFREVMSVTPFVRLGDFCARFGARASARETAYRFDAG